MARSISQYVGTLPWTCASADVTSVAGTDSATTLLAARPARMHVVIHNDSTALLYIKYGSDASATDHSYEVQADQHWEMPWGVRYTGILTGVWASATGNARITEVLEE